MARRRAPQNKAQTQAPENKTPDEDDDMLTAYTEKDAQLRRLLKAEHNEWAGTISRQDFRNIADSIRSELRGEQEVEMEAEDE